MKPCFITYVALMIVALSVTTSTVCVAFFMRYAGTTEASVEVDEVAHVYYVVDGDTFDGFPSGRVRLADVDAPERDEPGFEEAKQALADLTQYKIVYLDVDDWYVMDRYNRLVCLVYVRYNSTHLLNVNKWLVENGYAVIADYPNEFDPDSWTMYVHAPGEDLPELLYSELLETYISLRKDYESLNASYYELLEDYERLQQEHSQLLDEYTTLEGNYTALKSEYQSLYANYTSLQSAYHDLWWDYQSLLTEHCILLRHYVPGYFEILAWVFAVLTFLLALATIHFARKSRRIRM